MGAAVERKRIRTKRAGAFHHGDLREALIQAATQAVERHGHAEVALRPLAERLGVTQPSVYRHFKDKGALLAEVAQRVGTQLDEAMTISMQGRHDPFDSVAEAARAYVGWAHAHPNLFRLISSRTQAEQRQAPHPALPREHYYAGLAGVVPIDDPMLADAFRVSWAVVHGLATFVVEHVFMLVDTDAERLAVTDAAIACFIEMLRAKWPPSTRRARAGVKR